MAGVTARIRPVLGASSAQCAAANPDNFRTFKSSYENTFPPVRVGVNANCGTGNGGFQIPSVIHPLSYEAVSEAQRGYPYGRKKTS